MSRTLYIIARTWGGEPMAYPYFVHLGGEGNERWTDTLDKAHHFQEQDEAVKTTLATTARPRGGEQKVNHCCHFFLRKGVFQFCGDCTHSKAGQHVPIGVAA